ncbi:MAG: response regulator transcription factor, partial [Bacteroidetes bacterium]|nr:response regulator transcription factor [Bacteroidota bacterium]
DKKTLERVKLTDPYGYIVKPFTDKDLESNIELALYKFDKDLKKAREPAESGEDLVKQDTLYAKVNHKLVKIRLDDIKWIQAMDNYAVIQTISKKYVVSNTLKELNEKMQSRDMVRIHRSFIIHLDKVDTIEFSALHIDDEEIPIGKSYKHNLMKRIKLI